MSVQDHQLLYKLASEALRIETINFMEFFRLHGQMTSIGFYHDSKENTQDKSSIQTFYKIKNKLIDQLIEIYVSDTEVVLLRYFNSSKRDLEDCSKFLSHQFQREISIDLWQSI